MATIFNDINAALQHVVMHAELNSVKRLGKTCNFIDYDDYHILVALLTETAVSPEAKTFFENFALKKGKQDYVVRNYLYATGTFHAQTGIQPGDLFFARKSNADASTFNGMVLKLDEKGQISSYLGFETKQYEKQLVIVQNCILPELIYEAFSLKIPIEPLPINSAYLKFYGKFYEEILRRRNEYILGYKYTLGSTKGELLIYNKNDFFKYLSLGAPLRITQLFFLIGYDLNKALKICATLGKGLQVFTPNTSLQAGTILFTKEIGISMLIGNNMPNKSMPALVPSGQVSAYNIEWIKPDVISYFWEPAIDSFEYIKGSTNLAFKDINRLLGNIYCLNATYYDVSGSFNAIFSLNLVLEPEIWHPDVYKILANVGMNKKPSDWMSYLADKGNGFLDEKTIPQTGDFLFMEVNKELWSGIAINDTQMVYTTYLFQALPIDKIKNVKKIWRPSLPVSKPK